MLATLVLVTHAANPFTPDAYHAQLAQSMLIERGKAITTQRMTVIDPHGVSLDGVYTIADFGEDRRPTSLGQDVRAAAQRSNLAQLDRAAETGQYLYLFDRCLELGNDTVILPLGVGGQQGQTRDREALPEAAEQVGYRLVTENDDYQLYHISTPGTFGVVTTYRLAAIGPGAGDVALNFPAMEELGDVRLDHYDVQELAKYDLVCLAGFTDKELSKGEALIDALSAQGTRVLVVADVDQLLAQASDLDPTELPQREIVPIDLHYRRNVITINSPADHVNTTLAYQGIFRPDRDDVEKVNHLTVVNEGRTTIRLARPHLAPGLIMTMVGLMATAAYLIFMKKRMTSPMEGSPEAEEAPAQEEAPAAP